ncbi:hypothetical protein NEMIN01_2376 [Nematocida minor]|uniref:uncharacterized protein n=1 Tax=Nematocida minor TaxID=1912983 RepID=UPI00221EFA16|nr:uncharacterized protein NEMIN01_2376 [Nematocida minor]KAI5193038.1 hypothetical protein NEMIN01_2376 [Nematocida minor]
MKNQELKKILDAVGIVLTFFATKCRGSGNPLSDEIYTGVYPYVGEQAAEDAAAGFYASSFIAPPNSFFLSGHSASVAAVDNMADQYACAEPYMAENSVHLHPFGLAQNMPGTSRGQDIHSTDSLHLSSFFQDSTDGLLYNGYGEQSFNTDNAVEYHSVQIYPFIAESSAFAHPLDPMHGVPSTSGQSGIVDSVGFSSIDPYTYGSAQNGCMPFEQLPRTEKQSEEGREQQQSTAQPYASINAFNEAESTADLSRGGRAVGEKSSDFDGFEVDVDSFFCDKKLEVSENISDMINEYLVAPLQHIVQPCVDENASSKEYSGSVSAVGEKRKASEEDGLEACPIRRVAQKDKKKKKEGKRIDNLNVKLWNDTRLTNTRKASYKTFHKTMYRHENSRFDAYMTAEITSRVYQEKLRKDIQEFSAMIVPEIDKSAFFYFIASRTTNIATKYKDLLGLLELFKSEGGSAYKKMLMAFDGYYPGVVEDLVEYTRKHRPLRTSVRLPPTVWNETLGDAYVRKGLELNYSIILYQNRLSPTEGRLSPLVYAMRMILALPEVHQDFSTISEKLVKDTNISQDPSINAESQKVLLAICTLAKEAEENNKKTENAYENIQSALESMYRKNTQSEPTVSELYRGVYIILAEFYEKAKVFDEKQYILLGKCAIKHQKYIRCETILGPVSDSSFKDVCRHAYLFEMNKWDISPDVKLHYHIYYVDNTAHRSRMLCMPVHVDESGTEHYLHTIDEMISHIKVLYGVNGHLDGVHPFKVKKGTRKWTYINEAERGKTVKDLAGYEVVFYRIEERAEMARCTFAEFWPLCPQEEDAISIPLFLTPLMRSAVELGPFSKKREHAEIESMEFVDRVPDVYIYSQKYTGDEYSDTYAYYSNLHILLNTEKQRTFDCYAMDYQIVSQADNPTKAVWYVNVTDGANAYTHCLLDGAFKEKADSKELSGFIDVLESRKYNKDSKLHGIWLKNRDIADSAPEGQTERVYAWVVNIDENKQETKKYLDAIKMKAENTKEKETDLEAVEKDGKKVKMAVKKSINDTAKGKGKSKQKAFDKELFEAVISERPNEQTELIVFRNVNESKSNLGAHNEILDVLISTYNK